MVSSLYRQAGEAWLPQEMTKDPFRRCWRWCYGGGDGGGDGGEGEGAPEAAVDAQAEAEATEAAANAAAANAAGVAAAEDEDPTTPEMSVDVTAPAADAAAAQASAAATAAAEASNPTAPTSFFSSLMDNINPATVAFTLTPLSAPVSILSAIVSAARGAGVDMGSATPGDPAGTSEADASDTSSVGEGMGADLVEEGLIPDPKSVTGTGRTQRTARAALASSIEAPSLPIIQPIGLDGANTGSGAVTQSAVIDDLQARQKGAQALDAILKADPKKGFESTIHAGRGLVDPSSLFAPKLFSRSISLGG